MGGQFTGSRPARRLVAMGQSILQYLGSSILGPGHRSRRRWRRRRHGSATSAAGTTAAVSLRHLPLRTGVLYLTMTDAFDLTRNNGRISRVDFSSGRLIALSLSASRWRARPKEAPGPIVLSRTSAQPARPVAAKGAWRRQSLESRCKIGEEPRLAVQVEPTAGTPVVMDAARR